jgi:WD40 repeat protein
MSEPLSTLIALAESVADGSTPDWVTAESSARSSYERALIARLRSISDIARLQASLSAGGDPLAAFADRPPIPPFKWGSLEARELVGSGRFGNVYRAWDPRLRRDVALKLLRARDGDAVDDDVIEEGRLAARVHHPNVVTIFGAQRIEGRTGLWMEYVEGRTLEAELSEHGPFDAERLSAVAMELCAALDAVHEAGLVHRDVKASNVMRDGRGRIVLGDFGTGRELDDPDDDRVGLTGTPAYLAPEIFRREPATPRSDVYSLGVLLFRLATGRFPIAGGTIREIRRAHDEGSRPSLGAIRRDLPAHLVEAVDRSLDPRPDRRFATARAFASALAATTTRPMRRVAVIAGTLTFAVAALMILVVASQFSSPPPLGAARPGAGVVVQQVFPEFQRDVSIRGAAHKGRWVPCARRNSRSMAICDLEDLSIKVLRAPQNPATEGVPRSMALFSPDGRRLAYVWATGPRDERMSLRVIDVSTNEERTLFEVLGVLVLRQWISSRRALHVTAHVRGEQRRDLLVPLDGGPPQWLWSWTDGVTSTALSPDGRTLTAARQAGPRNRDLYAIDTTTGRETWRLADSADDFMPAWTPDGRAIVFARDRAGGSESILIAAVTAAGLSSPVILHDLGRNRVTGLPMFTFGHDGALFLDVMTGGLRTAYVADVDLGRLSVGSPRALEPRTIEDTMGPDWSPDGSRIAYLRGIATSQDANGTLVIRRSDSDVERERVLPGHLLGWQGQVRWSPRGDHLAVLYADKGASQLGLLDVRRDELTSVASDVMNPRWDESGRALFFGKAGRVYRFDLETRQTSVFYGGPPALRAEVFDISPRLHNLLGRVPPGRTCRVQAFFPGDAEKIVEFDNPSCATVRWVAEGPQFLISLAPSPTKGEIWLANAETGERRLLPLETEAVVDMALSRDGRRLLYSAGNPRPIVWMVSGIDTADVRRNSLIR